MNAAIEILAPRVTRGFSNGLSLEEVRERAPAVFTESAHRRMSSRYTFIQTQRVLGGLMEAGFVPVDARQSKTRRSSPQHARHLIRLRRRDESVQIDGAVPEIVFLNSHDGSSAYQLRVGIFRIVCANGLIISTGGFPAFRVSHRRDVVDEAIAGALALAGRFDELGRWVELMRQRELADHEQVQFAERAAVLRFGELGRAGMAASQLLRCRRVDDAGADLWSIFNRVQENVLGGGLNRRSVAGRLTRTRRITSIREDVRLNGALWDIATGMLAA
jgi:Domain of unknown function (DUF932)